jgi:hypothetical protein
VVFAIHQVRADGRSSDGLFRQQQALLRTLPTPNSLLTDTIRIHWSWFRNGKAKRPVLRALPIASFSLFFAAATVVVGIFSSYVVDTTNLQVLVSSPDCGYLNLSTAGYGLYNPIVTSQAASLLSDCYDTETPSERCKSIFVNPRINFTREVVNCPWNSNMCLSSNTPAVAFDSGLLDVDKAFGLNLVSSDRVKFRRKTTCGVLSLEGHTSIIPAEEFNVNNRLGRTTLPGEEMMLMHYGHRSQPTVWNNATFAISLAIASISSGISAQYVPQAVVFSAEAYNC